MNSLVSRSWAMPRAICAAVFSPKRGSEIFGLEGEQRARGAAVGVALEGILAAQLEEIRDPLERLRGRARSHAGKIAAARAAATRSLLDRDSPRHDGRAVHLTVVRVDPGLRERVGELPAGALDPRIDDR